MIVGLVEGTQGQAVLFRTAIEAGFKAAGISTQHILSPATDTTLEGVDALLVFPNTADDCASSYQAEWASVGKRDGVRLFVPLRVFCSERILRCALADASQRVRQPHGL
jgi:hypothetical protein